MPQLRGANKSISMKRLFRGFISAGMIGILLLLGNCSEDGDPKPSDLIIGNWMLSTVNVSVKIGSQSLVDYFMAQGLTASEAQLYSTQITDTFKDVDGNLDIKKGGSYSTTSGGITDTGTWELTSDGKKLTMDKGTADAIVFTVTTLTSAALNLTADQSETATGLTITVHFEMAFTK